MADAVAPASSPDRAGVRIVSFAGSLRKGSFNRALLGAAQELAPPGMDIAIIEIGDLPFYKCRCGSAW